MTQRKDSDLGVSVVESFSESEHRVLSALDLEFDELQKWKINFRILNQVFQSIEITEEKLIYIS